MYYRIKRSAVMMLVLTVTCCITSLTFGQAVGASLNGVVTDSTGAAIPEATVTLKNVDTGLTQTATTSGEGVYRIAPLSPGRYSLSVQAKGFQTYLQQGIIITVDTASSQNVALKAGNVEQTVTVTANAELLNTTNGSLGQTINQVEVSQLPLNGRQPSTLVYLAPGITSGGNTYNQTGFSFPDATTVSANGGIQGSTYFLLDGVPNMDTYLGLPAPSPNADATQEFRVITNNFNAAYGFAPGAVVSIATKSGTNSVHGGIFDFYRDRIFNAADYFSHEVNPLHQNQFGAYAGGPILKNKLFIFGNYQGTRNATASTSLNSYLPTPAMLNGDFSALSSNGQETMCTSGASSVCPFGMVNGTPNQLLPGYSYNATAVTVATTALPTGQQPDGLTYYTSAPYIAQYDEGTGRLDYDINQSQRLFLRSFIRSFIQPSGDVPGNLLAMNNNYNYDFSIQTQYYNETLGHTWTISPTMVNVASVFWAQLAAHNGAQATTSNKQPFCWSKYINITELPGSCYVEGFSVGGDGFNVGYYEPSQEERTTYGLYDDLTKTWGKHTFSFGINIQHQFAEEYTQYPTQPEIDFNGQYTGVGLADFLVGDLSSMFQGAGEVADVNGWQPGFYGQDQYRMRPNLTLTAGLRWDPNIPPKIANGRAAAFVSGQQSTVYPNAPTGLVFPGDSGIGDGIMRTTYGYWEPRIGLAWQPRGLPHTSFHGGFGLFTSPMIYSQYNHTADNAPFAPTFNLQGTNTTPLNFNDPWSGFAGTGGVSPFPPFASSSYRPPSTATFASGLSIPATFDPDFKLGVTQSWNVTVEQQIGQNMVFRLAYVGSETYHAPFILDRNPGIYATSGSRSTYPAFGEILDTFSFGTASYHSMQVSLDRRLSHNLQFQTNFTWSRTLDLASSANISFGTNQLGDPFDLAWSHGVSSENVPLRWVSNFIYTTPYLRGHNTFMQQVLGGWEVSAIITAQSGFPFGVGAGLGNNQSEAQQYEDRADVVSGQSLDVRQGGKSNWLNSYFNTNAFIQNAPGTFGNSGKNIMQAPPLNYTDAGIDRNWTYRDRYTVQFRWEMFNAFNQPSFSAPNAGNQISLAGINTGGSEGKITSTGSEPARIGQMALKFTF
ncbi:MAG: carboxypeptidase regulatory-like domain-containing protein [Silvibacterium sp.]